MDISSIGAALALTGGAATRADEAATRATSAANSANSAASAANAAAQKYSNLDEDAQIDRTFANYAFTMLQAEVRSVDKRMATAEAKLKQLT